MIHIDAAENEAATRAIQSRARFIPIRLCRCLFLTVDGLDRLSPSAAAAPSEGSPYSVNIFYQNQ